MKLFYICRNNTTYLIHAKDVKQAEEYIKSKNKLKIENIRKELLHLYY